MYNILNFIKPGIVTGKEMYDIFILLKKKKIALAAINCIDTNSINCILKSASKFNTIVIIQISFSGSIFFIGKNISSRNKIKYAIYGATLFAKYIQKVSKYYNVPVILHTDHCIKENLGWIDGLIKNNILHFKKFGKSLFSSHMIDLSNYNIKDNINICSKYLYKLSNININLEFELGCTGGEEDGLDNRNISNNKLYTNPNDVYYAYNKLIKISKMFIIAASFGNVHGVYKLNNVKLSPKILYFSQKLIRKKFNLNNKNPLNFVFHGGSGTSKNIIKESINYGIIKINLDTDIQWCCWKGILNYYLNNKEYLNSQLGNPEGIYKPNKKYYDPRIWIKYSQKYVINYLKKIYKLFNCFNLLK